MDKETKKYLIKQLESVLDAIKADTSTIDTDTALSIAGAIAHIPMSRESASIYLNITYSKFGQYVEEGKLPKGRKRHGWRELCWYKDELDRYKVENNL